MNMTLKNRMAIAVGTIGLVWGSVVTAATPAAATLPGLMQPAPQSSANDTATIKSVQARCPFPLVVVGGGGAVFGNSKVRLTMLKPVGGRYRVTAAAPLDAPATPWRVEAYAVCAERPSGYRIAKGASVYDSATFKEGIARCTGGRQTIGSGAEVIGSSREIGLQLSRTAGPLDITRATAREEGAGTTSNWRVLSFAICANPVNAKAEFAIGSQSGVVFCPDGKMVLSAGGGGGLTDLGPVFLRQIDPAPGLVRVDVAMTGAYPGGMVAQAICA